MTLGSYLVAINSSFRRRPFFGSREVVESMLGTILQNFGSTVEVEDPVSLLTFLA
jgi:hypothetical protein